jgi:protein TonB
VASLVLHALLFYALPFLKEARRQIPARLTARLAPQPPEPVPPKPETLSPQPLPAPKLPVVRPAPVAKAVVPPAPVSAPVLSVEPVKQATEPVFVVPAASSVPGPASSASTARLETQPASSGLDAGTVARFRLELMDLARRYKRYPRIAQDNGWEGRVELRIAFGEDGAIASLSVKKGSGRTVLDDEAQAMIRTAKSKATIPAALRGKAFAIEIPVDFFLKD